MQNHNRLLMLILALFMNFYQCQEQQNSYKKLSSLFNSYSENDEKAMVFVNMYIDKAKKENNLEKLIIGYEEAIYYTRIADRKLLYSDSAISIAVRSADKDQISRAYLGKGIIYYYNIRNHKKALEEYLKAFDYSKSSEDEYLKNKVTYHLGMVKDYLGYHKEASEHFIETAKYFESSMNIKNIHHNTKLNYESGYFNSIYRLSKCYHNMNLYAKEDSLIDIGLTKLSSTDQHSVEYAYFQKGKGIQLIRKGQSQKALKHLKLAHDILCHEQDFASLATVNFYLGKLYWKAGRRAESVKYLIKVDSIVNKFKYITPEIRASYEYLINDTKNSADTEKQLYYTNQLLKVDSIIINDFPKLSSKIKNEYDTERLTAEKKKLMEQNHIGTILYLCSIAIGFGFIGYIIYQSVKKEKELTSRYDKLKDKFQNYKKESEKLNIPDGSGNEDKSNGEESIDNELTGQESTRDLFSTELIEDVKRNLIVFQEKKQFLKKNIKLPEVAALIGTNRTTLSYVINDHLGTTFTEYLKILRINYITNLMMEEKKYLNYKIDSLAEMCGMLNRQVFTRHFREINGMSPKDFMRKRNQELDQQ